MESIRDRDRELHSPWTGQKFAMLILLRGQRAVDRYHEAASGWGGAPPKLTGVLLWDYDYSMPAAFGSSIIRRELHDVKPRRPVEHKFASERRSDYPMRKPVPPAPHVKAA
ncbi:hypothetical protein HIM_02043 [Hirsutella minnesotensis 3608]|nr:hypothetical protein HIM_02043 [Hirsutella minnesotensis 3608]